MRDQNDFRQDINMFPEYSQIADSFFDYWSEPNKKGKMRCELEKTWDTKRRLKRWFDNQIKWNAARNSSPTGNGVKQGTSVARIETAKRW